MIRNVLREGLISLLIISLATGPMPVRADQPNKPPEIVHDPVASGVKGQALTLKSKVTDDRDDVQSVTLYYTLSRDAAPFKVPLNSAGLNLYLGTIEAGVLSGVSSISYYIEAEDGLGATRETPWYVVTLKDPKEVPAAPVVAGAGSPAALAPPARPAEDGLPWGWILGGAAAIVGGAVLLSDSGGGGGGDSGDDGGGVTVTNSGTYVGTATQCFTVSGASPTCESRSISVIIDDDGNVFSDSLLPGQSLNGRLSGSDFSLRGTVGTGRPGDSGEIFFNGTIVNNRIVGTITGSAETAAGVGAYSGSFTASK